MTFSALTTLNTLAVNKSIPLSTVRCALALLTGTGLLALTRNAPAQTLAPGYSYSVFATAPTGYSKPDSIVVANGFVWVGYGNGTNSDGSDGKSTPIVQYDRYGNIVNTYNILGHNDGLKVDPTTGYVWVLQNQDGNPALSIINPTTKTVTPYTYASTTPGRGFDDVTFLNGKTYLSVSNPSALSDNVIVSATLSGGVVTTSSILTSGAVNPAVSDSDSLTHDLKGNLVLDDQGGQLVFVGNPGAGQKVSNLALTDLTGAGASVDDTLFINDPKSELLVTATNANAIYAITGPFVYGQAFSAETSGGYVGSLDQTTGTLSPVFTLAGSGVHGLALLSVPEPGTIALLVGMSVSGAGFLARRRRFAGKA